MHWPWKNICTANELLRCLLGSWCMLSSPRPIRAVYSNSRWHGWTPMAGAGNSISYFSLLVVVCVWNLQAFRTFCNSIHHLSSCITSLLRSFLIMNWIHLLHYYAPAEWRNDVRLKGWQELFKSCCCSFKTNLQMFTNAAFMYLIKNPVKQ